MCLGPLRCGQLAGSHHQDALLSCHMAAESFIPLHPTDGWSSREKQVLFQPLILTLRELLMLHSPHHSSIHPDKNTAQKGQRGPADIRLLGYEEI